MPVVDSEVGLQNLNINSSQDYIEDGSEDPSYTFSMTLKQLRERELKKSPQASVVKNTAALTDRNKSIKDAVSPVTVTFLDDIEEASVVGSNFLSLDKKHLIKSQHLATRHPGMPASSLTSTWQEETPKVTIKQVKKSKKVKAAIYMDSPYQKTGKRMTGRVEITCTSKPGSILFGDLEVRVVGLEDIHKISTVKPNFITKGFLLSEFVTLRRVCDATVENQPEFHGRVEINQGIPEGAFVYEFEAEIPPGCPSSFQSPYGTLKYAIVGSIEFHRNGRPKKKLLFERNIWLQSQLPRNDLFKMVRIPVTAYHWADGDGCYNANSSSNIGVDHAATALKGAQEGTVLMTCEVEHVLCFSGLDKEIACTITNRTAKKVSSINLSLTKVTKTFVCNKNNGELLHYHSHGEDIASSRYDSSTWWKGVDPAETQKVNVTLHIPKGETSVSGCLIDVSYKLIVKASNQAGATAIVSLPVEVVQQDVLPFDMDLKKPVVNTQRTFITHE